MVYDLTSKEILFSEARALSTEESYLLKELDDHIPDKLYSDRMRHYQSPLSDQTIQA